MASYSISSSSSFVVMVAIEEVLVTFERRILIISVENTYFHKNYTLFGEDFFTDAKRTLYGKSFPRRIKFGEASSFVAVGKLIYCCPLKDFSGQQ